MIEEELLNTLRIAFDTNLLGQPEEVSVAEGLDRGEEDGRQRVGFLGVRLPAQGRLGERSGHLRGLIGEVGFGPGFGHVCSPRTRGMPGRPRSRPWRAR